MRAMLALAPLAAFFAAVLVARLLLTPAGRRLALDTPNDRSLHAHPVPRTGGLAILAGVAAACALAQPGVAVTLGAALALAAVSFADDLLGLPTLVRLAAHIAAASAVLAFELGYAEPVLFTMLLLAIAWYTNLYNFMDGSDGLAGGMALIGFSFYGAAAAVSGSTEFALVNFCIAASAAAFLLYNFHPARIFMGDAGSVPLGFLAAALGMIGWLRGDWTWWFPLLVFSPFIVDASVTLARRLLRRERVWQAHRDHYYQRLVRLGWGHRSTALAEYVLMFACGALALAALALPAAMQAATLAAMALVYLVLITLIERSWQQSRAAGRT